MQICPRLQSVLEILEQPFFVVARNFSRDDIPILEEYGMEPSRKEGDKALVGKLTPSHIHALEKKLSAGCSLEHIPAVPKNPH